MFSPVLCPVQWHVQSSIAQSSVVFSSVLCSVQYYVQFSSVRFGPSLPIDSGLAWAKYIDLVTRMTHRQGAAVGAYPRVPILLP